MSYSLLLTYLSLRESIRGVKEADMENPSRTLILIQTLVLGSLRVVLYRHFGSVVHY